MTSILTTVLPWLRRRAENIAALLLAAMFCAFIVQIFMRYVVNWPVGWSTEVCALAWLWGILWSSAFVLNDHEEIRFDLVYGAARGGVKRLFRFVSSAAAVVLYSASLPATVSYVSFMQVERSAYMGIRFDYLFSIYLAFAVTMVVRHFWYAWCAFRGRESGLLSGHGPQ